jgi:hypothetical protein
MTLTWDQGSEMAHHDKFSEHFADGIFFALPASPWQRGANENTNGLLRQYFPKGRDLRIYSPRTSAKSKNASTTDPESATAGRHQPNSSRPHWQDERVNVATMPRIRRRFGAAGARLGDSPTEGRAYRGTAPIGEQLGPPGCRGSGAGRRRNCRHR